MREEWIEVEGGTSALKLWPETPAEAALSDVERALLRATLHDQALCDRNIPRQIEDVGCACRHLTGYGMFLELTVTAGCEPSTEQQRTAGSATLNWRESSRVPLAAVAFLKGGLLELLEIYPSDGENWSVVECREISSASLEEVRICAVDRDALGPGWASTG